MSTSVFIARLIGPVMLVIGLAVFTNQRAFREMAEEFLASRALLFLSGLLIMPVGLAIVLTHNIWAADGRVMITLFGWLNVIGGALRLFAPAYVMQTGRAMLSGLSSYRSRPRSGSWPDCCFACLDFCAERT
jgi:predicted MFS family arabinose efflux permease